MAMGASPETVRCIEHQPSENLGEFLQNLQLDRRSGLLGAKRFAACLCQCFSPQTYYNGPDYRTYAAAEKEMLEFKKAEFQALCNQGYSARTTEEQRKLNNAIDSELTKYYSHSSWIFTSSTKGRGKTYCDDELRGTSEPDGKGRFRTEKGHNFVWHD